MAVSNTTTSQTFTGDGSTTAFAIPFYFYGNTQVKVKITDTLSGTITVQTVGVDYTISGGDPGTTVNMTSAPVSTDLLTIYRSTPLTQVYDFLNNTVVNMENVEKALDYIVFMAQELSAAISSLSSGIVSAYVVNTTQSIAAAGTIAIAVDTARQICPVEGSGGATTANTTTAIDNGTIDGQEIVLRGTHATNSVTLNSATTNLEINGSMVLIANSTIYLIWNDTSSKWIEVGRSN